MAGDVSSAGRWKTCRCTINALSSVGDDMEDNLITLRATATLIVHTSVP